MPFDRNKYKIQNQENEKKKPIGSGKFIEKTELIIEKKSKIRSDFLEENKELLEDTIKSTTTNQRKTMEIEKRDLQYDELWKDKDIVVIFGPPGAGKSTWAFQVANYIAQGSNDSKSECFVVHGKPKIVGFFDFEDDIESIVDRTRNEEGQDHPDLELNILHYIDVDPVKLWKAQESSGLSNLESLLLLMKMKIEELEIEVVFIDNMTKIGETIEDAKGANPFLKAIITFAKELDITLIMLAHTPKVRDSDFIELNHLKGSSSIAGAIDAAIGMKRVNEILYIKQVKHRHTTLVYHSNNVATFRLDTYDNMKWLRFECMDSEKRILGLLEEGSKSKLPDEEFLFEVYKAKKEDKLANEEIMSAFDIQIRTIYNYCNIIEEDKNALLRYKKWLKNQK